MPGPQIELSGATIVFRGSLNPAIFHPQWFAAQGLVAPEEADAALVTVVSAQFSQFVVGSFQVQVTQDLCTFATTKASFYAPLKDLAVSTFRVLPHTPLTMLGMNRQVHFKTRSKKVWHAFGHRIAPKEQLWDPILKKPGTGSLTIQAERPDGYFGYVRVRVEPSQQVKIGVFVEINDHFQLRVTDPGKVEGATQIVDMLDSQWAQSSGRSDDIIKWVGKNIARP